MRHRLPYVQPTDIKIDKRAGTPAASTFKDLVSGGIKVKSERFDSGAHPEELWRRAPGSLLATDKLYLVDKSATTWSKDYSQCDTFGSTARVASVDGSAAMPIGDLTNTEQSVNFDLATVSTAHTNKAFRMCIKCTNCKVLHDIDLTGALHKFFVTDLNSNSESTQVSSKVCTGYSRLPTPFVFPVVPPTPDLPSILSPPPPPRPSAPPVRTPYHSDALLGRLSLLAPPPPLVTQTESSTFKYKSIASATTAFRADDRFMYVNYAFQCPPIKTLWPATDNTVADATSRSSSVSLSGTDISRGHELENGHEMTFDFTSIHNVYKNSLYRLCLYRSGITETTVPEFFDLTDAIGYVS